MIPMQLAKGAEVLGAFTDGRLVGVSAAAPPGECKPAGAENLRMLSAVLPAAGLAGTLRVIRWFRAWGRHDPVAAHWHVGPVGVEPHAQGQGFGSMLIGRFCRRMDSQGAAAYLETERATNVSFYERFGFQVVGQASILGVENWFMWRDPRAAA